MFSFQWVRPLTCGALIVLVYGCSGHPARVLAPDSATGVASASGNRTLGAPDVAGALACDPDYVGPVLTISGPGVEYTYPTGGYSPGVEAQVPIEVALDKMVRFRWSADASSGCTEVRAFRWTLDIEDLTDETPRIDEDTDLAHWSVWSRAKTAKLDRSTVAGWAPASVHYFYIDVTDELGYRSLGVFRITAVEPESQPGTQPGRAADGVGDGER